MPDTIFQEAFARVRTSYDDDAWLALNPRQITEAIYREIRRLDAERLRLQNASEAPPSFT